MQAVYFETHSETINSPILLSPLAVPPLGQPQVYAFAGVEGAETLPLEPAVAKVFLRRLEAQMADPQLVRFASRGRGAFLLPAGDVPQGGPGHLPGVIRGLLADEPLTSGEAPRARLRLAVRAALVERVPRVQGPGLGARGAGVPRLALGLLLCLLQHPGVLPQARLVAAQGNPVWRRPVLPFLHFPL